MPTISRSILDAAALDQCDLVGVSMGASIALNFALDHPERVGSLVLISPGLVAWEWTDAWSERWRAIVKLARNGKLDQARQLWWQHPLFESTRSSPGGPALFDSIMRFSGAQWVRDDHLPMLPDVEQLHMLRTRTLLRCSAHCQRPEFAGAMVGSSAIILHAAAQRFAIASAKAMSR